MANDFSVALASGRVKRKLNQLVKLSHDEIQRTLLDQGESLASFQRRLVPVESGDLRRSIEVTKRTTRKGEPAVVVSAGDDDAYYARWVEFGTKEKPGHPFFFPPYRARRKDIKKAVVAAVKKAARQAAAK